MTIAERLKQLRREFGFSQEAVGAQGFVSTPGWIKIENGQRQPSEKLIDKLITWLVRDKHLRATASAALRNELLVLKHLGNSSGFVRALATDRAKNTGLGHLLAPSTPVKAKRGRPTGTASTRKAVAA